jgi:hypothetical protein
MVTFVIFIVSLVLLVFLFLMKSYEVFNGKKIFLEDVFLKCDALIHRIILKLKFWWGHISFKNTRLIFSWLVASIRKSIIAIKRRFDHEQSHFFTKKEVDLSKPKNSPSFFLKDVAEYKKTLREGNGGGKIES